MSSFAYSLPLPGFLTSHGSGRALLLRDGAEHDAEEELTALIHSGDYFAVLATRLDTISDNLGSQNEAEAAILQHIVNSLLHLDRKYKIVKK